MRIKYLPESALIHTAAFLIPEVVDLTESKQLLEAFKDLSRRVFL
jgi:hypothetical protein